MKPSSAKQQFLEYADMSAGRLASLSPTQGTKLMLDCYRDERAEGCSLDQDGDMLLFQWGVYDWGDGEHFEFNIIRQFIEMLSCEDIKLTQLSLTFRFAPDVALRALPTGNRWCTHPEELADFRHFIESSRPLEEVRQRGSGTVSLHLGEV